MRSGVEVRSRFLLQQMGHCGDCIAQVPRVAFVHEFGFHAGGGHERCLRGTTILAYGAQRAMHYWRPYRSVAIYFWAILG